MIPLRQTPAVRAGKHNPPVVRARDVDLRRVRRQARRVQVTLPHRGVQARVRVAKGRPVAHPDPSRHRAVEVSLPPTAQPRQGATPRSITSCIGQWAVKSVRADTSDRKVAGRGLVTLAYRLWHREPGGAGRDGCRFRRSPSPSGISVVASRCCCGGCCLGASGDGALAHAAQTASTAAR